MEGLLLGQDCLWSKRGERPKLSQKVERGTVLHLIPVVSLASPLLHLPKEYFSDLLSLPMILCQPCQSTANALSLGFKASLHWECSNSDSGLQFITTTLLHLRDVPSSWIPEEGHTCIKIPPLGYFSPMNKCTQYLHVFSNTTVSRYLHSIVISPSYLIIL